MECAAIIVAAGRGERAGAARTPKQYRRIGGRSVLAHAAAAFADHAAVDRVLAVIGPDHAADYAADPDLTQAGLLPPVVGGEHRQESVLRGLEALADDPPDTVLIHDAARPFVGTEVIGRVLDRLATHPAVIPTVPIVNTVKRVAADGTVSQTIPRETLVAAQTPQGFAYEAILAAHRQAAGTSKPFTDDAAIAAASGLAIERVDGDPANVKLTTADDLAMAEARFSAWPWFETRTGQGFDVHAFGPGDAVMLGGIRIAHDAGLTGHSDADVILHALTDAVLAAISDGDIGAHFPPGDPQWQGAASDRFLAFAADRVRARGGTVVNLDATLIGEAPKLAPHRDAIRARIADIAGLDIDRIAVKATTSEGLGFTGRREGLAAQAIATVRLPSGR